MLVPANTFIATFEAIAQAGGVPVPVDPSLWTTTTSTSDVSTPHARSHAIRDAGSTSSGQLADAANVAAFAATHGLAVIEDACQSHGADRDGAAAGTSMGAAYSFIRHQESRAFGATGAVVTSDAESGPPGGGRGAARPGGGGAARRRWGDRPPWPFQAMALSKAALHGRRRSHAIPSRRPLPRPARRARRPQSTPGGSEQSPGMARLCSTHTTPRRTRRTPRRTGYLELRSTTRSPPT